MKEQLVLLQKLQEIDARTQEARNAIASLPEKLRPAKDDLARLEALLQQERDQVAETERWRKEQQELIDREEEAVRYSKSKLQQAKSAKEFAAASREVDNKRRSITEREAEMKKVLAAMEATTSNLAQHEQDVAKLRASVEAEEAQLLGKLRELQAEAEAQAGGRDELAAQLPKPLLKKYETVQKRRGIAVVPVVEGVCQGCFMTLPPQLNNVLARFESIESCPACNRLLYRAELVESDEPNAEE